ncbi:MAG: hypothetical protein QME61_02165, partial [Patescibacteria group bacterium]|nr:hypothetical protein [Patescibacteria group bacterium]
IHPNHPKGRGLSNGVNKDPDEILKLARKRKIYLDDGWRKSPIVPPDTEIEKMGYTLGSCPRAEKIANSILNLPTHINISKKRLKRSLIFLDNFHNIISTTVKNIL